jgi:Zn-dependent M28 family amino/carboxypeptidase
VRFQTVKFPFFRERGTPVLDDLRRRRDFDLLEYSPGADVTARIRALDTPACDAAALDPVERGEIALVARGTCTFRRKAMSAQRAGAAALLVVDREARRPVPGTLGRPSGIDIPVIAVTATAAARLARNGAPVHLRVDTVSEQRTTRNVVAETSRADRVAMAGAHLDSVEEGPGINDDGSGVAALLELAERLPDRPGLRLGFWAAEELGLYGSRHYVGALNRAQRRAITAYVNLDMVGSPHPRPVVYDTDDIVERTLRSAFPGDEAEIELGGSSDHASFEKAGIPVGGLFTGASEKTDPCYHRACDTERSADADMAARMAQATATALTRLAG